MNLCLSQLSWREDEQKNLFKLLPELGINKIECVFSKIDKDYDESKILKFKEEVDENNLEVYSAQSIFYGSDCKNLDDPNFIEHLKKVLNLSKIVSLKNLVFGSPTIRKTTRDDKSLMESFKIIDDLFNEYGINLVIEPNTRLYGGELFYTSYEIIDFLKDSQFSRIRTMIDTHNSLLENIDISNEFYENKNYIEHIHISEYGLTSIDNFYKFSDFKKSLIENNYNKTITLEIKECDELYSNIEKFTKFFK
jgi:sugar phosphate isomerase/epimerase